MSLSTEFKAGPDIFLSLRFGESLIQAQAVKAALEKQGLSVFLCAVEEGEGIATEIAHNLAHCGMVVIFGSRTYGMKTDVSFSTFQELEYILHNKKPFFLIKMCDRFAIPETDLKLHGSISYFPWQPDPDVPVQQLPPGLVEKIVAKHHRLMSGGHSTSSNMPLPGFAENDGITHRVGLGADAGTGLHPNSSAYLAGTSSSVASMASSSSHGSRSSRQHKGSYDLLYASPNDLQVWMDSVDGKGGRQGSLSTTLSHCWVELTAERWRWVAVLVAVLVLLLIAIVVPVASAGSSSSGSSKKASNEDQGDGGGDTSTSVTQPGGGGSTASPTQVPTATTANLFNGFVFQDIDLDGDKGAGLAVTTAGLPVLVYWDTKYSNIKLCFCTDVKCSAKEFADITDGTTAKTFSLAVNTLGWPIFGSVATHNGQGSAVMFVCGDDRCSTWKSVSSSILQTTTFLSVAVSSNNRGIIAFKRPASADNMDMQICSDRPCSSAYSASVGPVHDSIGDYNAVGANSKNFPVLTYLNRDTNDLLISICIDERCSSARTKTLLAGGRAGQYNKLAIASDDRPVVASWGNDGYHMVVCDDADCQSSKSSITEGFPNANSILAMALNSEDRPVLLSPNAITFCDDLLCTSYHNTTIAYTGTDTILWQNMVLADDDRPVVSGRALPSNAPKVAICGNPECA